MRWSSSVEQGKADERHGGRVDLIRMCSSIHLSMLTSTRRALNTRYTVLNQNSETWESALGPAQSLAL